MALWTFVMPNCIIALSYLIIPVALGMLMLLNPNLPHQWLLLLFISFILACGGTHAMHVVDHVTNNGPPPSLPSMVIDWTCAVISIATGIAMGAYVRRLQGFLEMVVNRHA